MIELDTQSREPIYLQICTKIRELIALGVLKDGDQLPTVRALARDLGINHNTIQKSISVLEEEGLLCTLAGKGTFVRCQIAGEPPYKQRALEELRALIDKNRIYGIGRAELLALCDELFPESQHPSKGA